MEYNVINQYLVFVKREFHNFFKLILGKDYHKSLCEPFIDRYIEVRYFNETNYYREKDIVNRLNKELIDVYKKLVDEDNEDILKNEVALFGYIMYFDDVCIIEEPGELINLLAEDEDIKLERSETFKKDIRTWFINLKKKKDKFNSTLLTKEYNLIENRLYRKIYELILEHNVNISYLYSEYAVDKVYNSKIISEDKLFITYILSSAVVLDNAINLDFSRHYVVDMVNTLFDKEKKMNRLFNVLNNMLAKKSISIKISYDDYLNNRDKVNKLINDGYSFAILIDDTFDGNINELVLFPYILIDSENEYFDMLMKEKEHIMSKIIKL